MRGQQGSADNLNGVIELHLRGQAAPGRRGDLVAFLRQAIPFYEEPGGIRVRVMWDVNNSDRFIEVMEYADQQTHDLDQARVAGDAEMQDYLRRWRALLVSPPEVETYWIDPIRKDG